VALARFSGRLCLNTEMRREGSESIIRTIGLTKYQTLEAMRVFAIASYQLLYSVTLMTSIAYEFLSVLILIFFVPSNAHILNCKLPMYSRFPDNKYEDNAFDPSSGDVSSGKVRSVIPYLLQ